MNTQTQIDVNSSNNNEVIGNVIGKKESFSDNKKDMNDLSPIEKQAIVREILAKYDMGNVELFLVPYGAQVIVFMDGKDEETTKFFYGMTNYGAVKNECVLDIHTLTSSSFQTEPDRLLRGIESLMITKLYEKARKEGLLPEEDSATEIFDAEMEFGNIVMQDMNRLYDSIPRLSSTEFSTRTNNKGFYHTYRSAFDI